MTNIRPLFGEQISNCLPKMPNHNKYNQNTFQTIKITAFIIHVNSSLRDQHTFYSHILLARLSEAYEEEE